MKTLKILGLMMAYPKAELMEALPSCRAVLAEEKWLGEKTLQALGALAGWMASQELLDLQAHYVALFDRTPSLCLHLFEHVHGDSRDRGQALVDLSEIYQEAGLLINQHEMPDYLPLFLEYLAMIDPAEARQNLGEAVNILSSIAARLQKRNSLYASLFEALVEAAATRPNPKLVAMALEKASGAALASAELDAAWQEQFAFENNQMSQNGEGEGSCPKADEMLRRMEVPLPAPSEEVPS